MIHSVSDSCINDVLPALKTSILGYDIYEQALIFAMMYGHFAQETFALLNHLFLQMLLILLP